MNFIIKLFLNAIAVVITAYILPGVHLENFGYAVLLAALLALLNVSVKPVLVFLTIPATIVSLGLFLLVINAFIIEIAAWILKPGFNVSSFWQALFFSILLSITNSIFERLTVRKIPKEDNTMQVFDKDGNRIA
ncbi:MAG TPA: phage holin family protein [Chitinophagales bacterium]|nr:phage holin family protein [Chitinophagales bacterium]